MTRERPEIAPGITVDRDEGFGKPVIKGTSVTVESILLRLAGGASIDSLASDCGIGREGMLAAIGYASKIAGDEPPANALYGGNWPEELSPGVTRDPRVRFGKPVLKGTRLDAASVLGYLATGESTESLIAEFPTLT